MVWYNPFTWFEKGDDRSLESTPTSGDLKLYCANPQCGGEIKSDEMAYTPEFNEIYHDGECAQLANAHRAMRTGEMTKMRVGYVSRQKVIDLLMHGNDPSSASDLEGKLTED